MEDGFSPGSNFALAFEKLSLSTPCERRKSVHQHPFSHPVSPAGSDGAGNECAPGSAGSGGSPAVRSGSGGRRALRSPTSPPATSHFSIPAIRGCSLSPLPEYEALTPLPACSAASQQQLQENVTLNLFIGSTPSGSSTASKRADEAAEEVARLRKELKSLHEQAAPAVAAQLEQQQQLDAAAAAAVAEQHAAAAAAAVQQKEAAAAAQEERSSGVSLVINVVEAEAPPPQPASAAPTTPVQLLLNIVEQPAADQQEVAQRPQQQAQQDAVVAAQGTGAGSAAAGADAAASTSADHAALQQQLARAEACREELARQAGQLKGRIAKLEGVVMAGESRVRSQAAELETLKGSARELEAALSAAQAQVGVTPERVRTERQRLAEAAAEAGAAADEHAGRVQRLAAVLAYEARERRQLAEFAAREHQLLIEAERGAAAEAAQWRADAGSAAAQLAEARQRLVDTDAALMQRDEEVRQLRCELEAAQVAVESAAQLAGEWRQKAEQFDRDRQTAAANIRKAERELELVAQDNERMFRQLNFVRTRLMGQLGGLDCSVPDIGKLARELQSWCDRETAQRMRSKT